MFTLFLNNIGFVLFSLQVSVHNYFVLSLNSRFMELTDSLIITLNIRIMVIKKKVNTSISWNELLALFLPAPSKSTRVSIMYKAILIRLSENVAFRFSSFSQKKIG
ncbi:MAG: hypothetical protein AYP45_01890 [Candidatus Brocadia carolinensis]|uniref:Uncharacterized protein n=1 Tax=Candidatus Brocadia carolinensis TaxID=1004156 RepID=A0A1V4AX39_9BACT|nr:MAG: hypothetical protein AYP45_01890 [Candidatus Brocadia caroliniensis]